MLQNTKLLLVLFITNILIRSICKTFEMLLRIELAKEIKIILILIYIILLTYIIGLILVNFQILELKTVTFQI